MLGNTISEIIVLLQQQDAMHNSNMQKLQYELQQLIQQKMSFQESLRFRMEECEEAEDMIDVLEKKLKKCLACLCNIELKLEESIDTSNAQVAVYECKLEQFCDENRENQNVLVQAPMSLTLEVQVVQLFRDFLIPVSPVLVESACPELVHILITLAKKVSSSVPITVADFNLLLSKLIDALHACKKILLNRHKKEFLVAFTQAGQCIEYLSQIMPRKVYCKLILSKGIVSLLDDFYKLFLIEIDNCHSYLPTQNSLNLSQLVEICVSACDFPFISQFLTILLKSTFSIVTAGSSIAFEFECILEILLECGIKYVSFVYSIASPSSADLVQIFPADCWFKYLDTFLKSLTAGSLNYQNMKSVIALLSACICSITQNKSSGTLLDSIQSKAPPKLKQEISKKSLSLFSSSRKYRNDPSWAYNYMTKMLNNNVSSMLIILMQLGTVIDEKMIEFSLFTFACWILEKNSKLLTETQLVLEILEILKSTGKKSTIELSVYILYQLAKQGNYEWVSTCENQLLLHRIERLFKEEKISAFASYILNCPK